ncbi:Vma22p ASCRUDRAFT_70939 [Ascoidea rubescens DSM 1968]|uniref:Vacuolar ATPase assembly protein VMA22 n=1 Tax=Ascoidea rubescens DSM 1968 TaxID=1344418 RepID=A0A1D2VFL4_9ASCO|nr:hypothetical protein ASCRUDRAFT_70939 [Ascoidea rubescens DSM 1968]ODV60426.1 hypothetical protein ASCRUDRAFT_70939 [Ascoidea rubescens DSM 1968]
MAVKEKTIVDLFGSLKLVDRSQLEYLDESPTDDQKKSKNNGDLKSQVKSVNDNNQDNKNTENNINIDKDDDEDIDILSSINTASEKITYNPIDQKIIEYLNLLSKLYDLTLEIDKSSSMGFINLARANYVNFGGISKRYSQLYWDMRDREPKYIVVMNLTQEKQVNFLIKEKETPIDNVESIGLDDKLTEQHNLNESNLRKRNVANLNQSKKVETETDDGNSDESPFHKEPIQEETIKKNEKTKKMKKKIDKSNGINMFGGALAAYPLKQSQKFFIEEFKLLIELANLRTSIENLAIEISKLRLEENSKRNGNSLSFENDKVNIKKGNYNNDNSNKNAFIKKNETNSIELDK